MIYRQGQIDKYLKKPDAAIKCFVVYGSNEGLIDENVKSLAKTVVRDLYDPFNSVYITDIDEGTIAGEYNARSLMGERRVIVIKDGTNDLTKIFKNILGSSDSDSLIIVSSSSLNKSSSLVKLATERDDMAAIACYDDRDEDIYSTARAVLVENGCTIANDALQVLCSRLSNDRKTNIGELEKLITFMGDKKNVVVDDVVKIIGDSSASNTDDVCYYTASGNAKMSQKAFDKLVNEGTEPISVVRAMSFHFGRILQCRALIEKGETLDKAVNKILPRAQFYREASLKKQVSIWSKDKLLGVMEFLYKCERDCKTTGMPVVDVASHTLLQIASTAARLTR